MQNSLLLYVAELFYATALFFAKASILSFYWRMFRVTNIKLPIQILGACSLIWIIVRVSIMSTSNNPDDEGLTVIDIHGHLPLHTRGAFLGPLCRRILRHRG
jgi:hypothetical protein